MVTKQHATKTTHIEPAMTSAGNSRPASCGVGTDSGIGFNCNANDTPVTELIGKNAKMVRT